MSWLDSDECDIKGEVFKDRFLSLNAAIFVILPVIFLSDVDDDVHNM